ncbi:MAG: AMP-binding protein, partial [Pseudomonadota bacterium]
MSDTSEFSRLYELLSPLPRDQPVLISEGAALTASDLADRAQHLWTSLSAIPAGTRIATRLPDAPSTAFTLLALSHHVQVMALNPALTATETRSALAGSGARALLCLPDDPVARSLDIPCAHVSTDGDFIVPDIGGAQTDRATEWVGVVLMTSGSTGTPKRVPLTCAQLYRSADRIARALQLSEQDRAVHALPMFHIGALVDLLLAPLLAKGSVAFATGMGAGPLRDAVLQNGGTWMQLVPTMLNRLRADLSPEETSQMGAQLRFIRSVSSDLAPDVQTRAEALFAGTPIIQMFGMTETAGQITTNPLPPQTRKLGSVGRAFECGLRINDLDEIEVQSDAVTSGYEGLPRHAHFTNDGWLQTGDLGTIDEDGFVFLTGRAKEIINRG